MGLESVRQRYAGQARREWDRLHSTPITRTEYLITTHCLERYLPSAGRVLDVGSGPGRYAIDLARRGYRVVMFDLLHEMLELGRAKASAAGVSDRVGVPVEGDMAALPFAGESFGTIISLGAPLSHLANARARASAVDEMARLVKPGGMVFLTGVTKLAAYRSAVYWRIWETLDRLAAGGARESGVVDGSQIWYLFAPGELEEMARHAGLEIIDRVGCEGLAGHLPIPHLEQVEADPRRWAIWREALLETCNERTIIGISNHLLVIARKVEPDRESRSPVVSYPLSVPDSGD